MDQALYSEAIRLRDDRKFEEAIRLLESVSKTAIDRDEHAAVSLALASCFLHTDLKEARQRLSLLNKERPRLSIEGRLYIDYTVGCLLCLEANWPEAIRKLEALSNDYSDLFGVPLHSWLVAEIEERLGISFVESGQPERGLSHLERALRIQSEDQANIRYNMAKAKHALGDLKGAITDCRLAIAASDPAIAAKAQYQLGVLLYIAGQFEESLQWLERATDQPLSYLGLPAESVERDLRRARAKVRNKPNPA